MAQGDFNINTAGVEISKVRTIGDVVRPPMLAPNRYNPNNEYVNTHPDIFSEGIGGDNRGKEPQTPPTSISQAYNTVGSKDDITQRLKTLTPNLYLAGRNEYDNVI
jgi:hypothetical protein